MKDNIKEIFNSMPTLDGDAAEQFFALLELPDEQFDSVYPLFKAEISKLYESEQFQKNLLTQMQFTPVTDIEEERASVQSLIDEINADDTLSANKKDMISSMFNSTLEVFEELLVSGRQSVKVKIVKLDPDAIIPKYAHPTDAGADICSIEDVVVESGQTKIIKTGIAVGIPVGYEIQVRPRSGLSANSGLRIANAPGTIDSDYRGEIGIIMTNTRDNPAHIDKGTKIAQLVIAPTPMIKWDEVSTVEELGDTARGAGGFGSTDVS